MSTKTPGQTAYEEDVRRCPKYHDGTERPTWDALKHWCKDTWHRNPTPREWPWQGSLANG